MKNLPGILILLASCSAFLPTKQTIRVASIPVEGTSPALPIAAVTPNTTAGEPLPPPSDTVPSSQPAVVSSNTTSGAGETGAGDSYSKSGLTSPLEFENESLRKERDELLATVADLKEQVKILSRNVTVIRPAQSAPQPVRYTQQYGNCSSGNCSGGFRPFGGIFRGRR